MTDDDKSLGDDATLGGENAEREIDAQSLGDQSTHDGHSDTDSVGDSSSLGDQLTFGGEGTGEVLDDGMEIVDLESRYTIERVLGKGGMGEVLLATDTRLERKVAIKRILGKAARSKTAVNRFLTEAKAVAALNHTNIVQIHDYGRDKQGPFLIMEYVAGQSLLERCHQGAIALEEAIELTVQLCDGLAAAHDNHIVHRDVKPANILLTKNNIPKLTDFGLAKAEAADTGMTQEGAVLGTHDFMPPEQRKDAALVDARSDLWSLAATLYQMLTGESPKVIRLNKVPSQLQDVLDKALEEQKDDRYQNVRAFEAALGASLTARSQTAVEPISDLGIGQCNECYAQNSQSTKFCTNCGSPLRIPCLACQESLPVWNKACGECGAKQSEFVEQQKSGVDAKRGKAESLADQSDFEQAIALAREITEINDKRWSHQLNWAQQFITDTNFEKQRQIHHAGQIWEEAKKHHLAFDYQPAIQMLEDIHPTIRQQVEAGGITLDVYFDQLNDDLLKVKRRKSEVDFKRAEAESAADQSDFEQAIALAREITEINDKRWSHQLNWAQQFITDTNFEKQRQIEDELNELMITIKNRVKARDLDGLLSKVNRAVKLQGKPGNLFKLQVQLIVISHEKIGGLNLSRIEKQAITTELAESIRLFIKAAEAGDVSSQFNLGLMYENGKGRSEDRAEAIKWYRKAAEQGYAEAQYKLGAMYENGKGVTEDRAEAIKWYRKAAEQGYAEAQYKLGAMYETGNSVFADLTEVAKWNRKAAEQGYAEAQYKLGRVYQFGEGVKPDLTEAFKWYTKAAEQDHAGARVEMGNLYSEGSDILPKNVSEAAIWYRKAAEQGNADAQYILGVMCAKDRSTFTPSTEEFEWIRKAAEQGNADAQYKIARLHPNPYDAFEWFRRAAEQDHAEAKQWLKKLN